MGVAVDALERAVIKSAKRAEKSFTRSLNDLPEYFLTVNLATEVSKELGCLAEMEVNFAKLCADLGVSEDRISRSGNADIVLKHLGSEKPRHIIELKRSVHKGRLKEDVIRLAQVCAVSKNKSQVRSNYLVIVTQLKERLASQQDEVLQWIKSEGINNVDFSCYEINGLEKFGNTRKTKTKSVDGNLYGEIWEFSLKSQAS